MTLQHSYLDTHTNTHTHTRARAMLSTNSRFFCTWVWRARARVCVRVCVSRTCSQPAPTLLHILVVASKLAMARHLPSGDQLTQRTVRVCESSRIAVHRHSPCEAWSHAPSCVAWLSGSLPFCLVASGQAQILTVLSPLQEASDWPAGGSAMLQAQGWARAGAGWQLGARLSVAACSERL